MRVRLLTFIFVCFIGIYSFSQEASDYCQDAPTICNFTNYYGEVSMIYGPYNNPVDSLDEDTTPLGIVFCGSIENNSWLKFTAADDTVLLHFDPFNCLFDLGIQAQVYETFDCVNFSAVSHCENSGFSTPFTLTAAPLNPGQEYYIMLDGQAGDECEYSLMITNILSNYSITNDTSICSGTSLGLSATGGISYAWSPAGFLSDTTSSNPICTPDTTTLFSVEIEGYDDCPDTTLSVLVNVDSCSCYGLAGNDTTICGLLTQLNAELISESWSGLWESIPGVGFSDITDPQSMISVINADIITVYWLQADSLGNTCTDSLVIEFLNQPILDSVSIFNETSFGECDGAIDTWFSGGTPPYTYLWNTDYDGCCPSNLCSGEYEVTLTDGNGCFVIHSFEINSDVGIHSSSSEEFLVFPNPFNEQFTIVPMNNEPYGIEIKDLTGKTIRSRMKLTGEYILRVSDLSSGIYILHCINNSSSYSIKIVKK